MPRNTTPSELLIRQRLNALSRLRETIENAAGIYLPDRLHEVLIARVRGVQGSSKAPNLRVSADLDRLVRRLETECRQIHGQYMALRKKLLAICDHTATMPVLAADAALQRSSAA